MSQDLLIEIGTEELPPKSLKNLSEAFEQGVLNAMNQAELSFKDCRRFATPRRLALLIKNVAESTADKKISKRGPALQAAFDDEGCPTKAAEGFARSCGVMVEDLETLDTNKGSWLIFQTEQKGQTVNKLIPDIVKHALDQLPIPKRMRWADLDAQFVRPVHWVVMLYGDNVIDAEILSVKSGRDTRGHRFHYPQPIPIPNPADYEMLLETTGKVIADFDRRRQTVKAQVEKAALKLNGIAVINYNLLDEVTAMVEWPVAVAGNFEKRFLDVPSETLILTMDTNQKYFHLLDEDGNLLPHFITISNIESSDMEQIRHGNERVIRPRFSDAEFFWNQDKKQRLDQHLQTLKTVVFQHKLGSLYDKTERIVKLAKYIAKQMGANQADVQRAAELCKCDLMTEMVGEFPSLQGIMGRYYALHDNEKPEVADAINQHYRPRFAGDHLPDSAVSQAVALADRLDSLLGIFAIGQIPTGDKDPYALRRAALGVLRILIEQKVNLDLADLLQQTAASFDKKLNTKDAIQPVMEFIFERLHAYYQDKGIPTDVLDAVSSLKPTSPVDIDKRLLAVNAFRKLPEAESLAAANKRIGNILKKIKGKIPSKLDMALFDKNEEKDLFNLLTVLSGEIDPLLADRKYEATLKNLARLREPVDAFFDNVMVMADDEQVKNNRIAMLNQLHSLFLKVADISRLQNQD